MIKDQFLIRPGVELSRQRNALRIEIIPPMSRCALRPKDDNAVMIRSRWNWRTDQLSRVWDHFEYCVQDERNVTCETCRFHKKQSARIKPFSSEGCLRRDSRGDWHIMHRPEKGWNSFSYWYPSLKELLAKWAIDIDEQKRDAHGVYWTYVIDHSDDDTMRK